jgi:hypothetical protein
LIADGARAFDRRLVDHRHPNVITGPAFRLVRGATSGHTTADDQEIGVQFDDLGIAERALAHGLSPSVGEGSRPAPPQSSKHLNGRTAHQEMVGRVRPASVNSN